MNRWTLAALPRRGPQAGNRTAYAPAGDPDTGAVNWRLKRDTDDGFTVSRTGFWPLTTAIASDPVGATRFEAGS
jgi:hypothetical protein